MRSILAFLVLSVVLFAGAMPARADQFGDIGFRVPAGWQKIEKGGFAILAGPLDARGKPRVAIFVAPGANYSGDFASWFEASVHQGEAGETSIARGPVRHIQARGSYDALSIESVAQDAQGTTTHRTYIAANPGGRAELFVYITYSDRAAQQYLPRLREFLDSVSYAHGDAPGRPATGRVASAPAPAAPRQPSGGRCRTITRQQCMSGMSGGFGGTMTPTYNCLPVSKTVCE